MSDTTPTSLQEKICSVCGQTKPIDEFGVKQEYVDGHRGQCKPCLAKRQKVYSRKYDANGGLETKKKYYKEHYEQLKQAYYRRRKTMPDRNKAYAAVNNAIASGKFVKQPCELCNEPIADFHHTEGYKQENWFVGIWLCRPHHAAHHVKLREEAQNAKQSYRNTRNIG